MGRKSGSSGGSSGRSSGYFSRPAASSSKPQQHSAPTQTATRPQAAAPPATTQQHSPMQQQQMQQQQTSGGGMLSGLGGMIMQGMAFGGGSAIAHRAVDGVMGPRTVVHEHKDSEVAPAAASSSSMTGTGFRPCEDESISFQQCLKDNSGDVSKCNWYYDALSTCQKTQRSS
uniref:CHCH domain-containing protein n=2 Tax=Noccaea caerulescens TaxID=107243 RepID=A0A1J3J9N0_NOCCA